MLIGILKYSLFLKYYKAYIESSRCFGTTFRPHSQRANQFKDNVLFLDILIL